MPSRLPDRLTLERNRDLHGRWGHVRYRRVLLCCVAVLPVLALILEKEASISFITVPSHPG